MVDYSVRRSLDGSCGTRLRASFVWGGVRRQQTHHLDRRHNQRSVDEPTLLLLHGCEGQEWRGGKLEVRGLSPSGAESGWLEEDRDDAARRHRYRIRLARPRWHELGSLENGDVCEEREETGVRTS